MVGVLTAWALLLAVAGIGKVFRPGPAAAAVTAARLPAATLLARPIVVRLTGLIEVLVAIAVIAIGGPVPAALLAASYLVLALVAWRMYRKSPGQDCGCFGRAAEPITRWHLGVDLAGVLVGSAAVLWLQPSIVDEIGRQGAAGGLLLVGLTVLLAWLCYQLMTTLPALLELRRKVAAPR